MEGTIMKKLTTLQRNVIYKEDLNQYMEEIENNGTPRGLCWAIWAALLVLTSYNGVLKRRNPEILSPYCNGMQNIYIEVFSQKPTNAKGAFWFDPDKTEIRIKILEKAISLTESKD
jgi:hypothetical protein